jgi:hypothetical protein
MSKIAFFPPYDAGSPGANGPHCVKYFRQELLAPEQRLPRAAGTTTQG